jgi:hypothetical protein
MADDPHFEARNHAHRLTMFSVAAGMVGVCLTGVGLIGVVKSVRQRESTVDELLTLSALLFLFSTAVNFVILRRGKHDRRRPLDRLADAAFFIALGLLLVACWGFTSAF